MVVLAFTCRTANASGLIYGATAIPAPVVSAPDPGISYFDTATIAPPNTDFPLVADAINNAATPNNESTLRQILPATPIAPEPSSLILTGFGFMGLLIYWRCRKNQSKAKA